MVIVETGWCSRFSRRAGRWRAPRALECAYRAPSLFAQQMLRRGSSQQEIGCDEDFGPHTMPGSSIVYISTHGQHAGGDYHFSATMDDHGVDNLHCPIVVLDTCDLVVGSPPPNLSSRLSPDVRLLLGFDGRSTNERGSSLRGRVFADLILNGSSVADAWICAVMQTAYYGPNGPYDKPIAIGVGDTSSEAHDMCNSADLSTIMGIGPWSGPATIDVRS